MYYLEMQAVVNTEPKLKTYRTRIRNSHFSKKDRNNIILIDYKFYQKVFLVLISLTTFLIIPESPKELEIICKNHSISQICKVW